MWVESWKVGRLRVGTLVAAAAHLEKKNLSFTLTKRLLDDIFISYPPFIDIDIDIAYLMRRGYKVENGSGSSQAEK